MKIKLQLFQTTMQVASPFLSHVRKIICSWVFEWTAHTHYCIIIIIIIIMMMIIIISSSSTAYGYARQLRSFPCFSSEDWFTLLANYVAAVPSNMRVCEGGLDLKGNDRDYQKSAVDSKTKWTGIPQATGLVNCRLGKDADCFILTKLLNLSACTGVGSDTSYWR